MKKVILATALLVSGSVLAAGLPTVTKPMNPGYLGWYAGVGILGSAQWGTSGYAGTDRRDSGDVYKQDSNPWGFTLVLGNRFAPNFGADLNFSYLSTMKYKNKDDTSKKVELKDNYYAFGDGYLFYPIFDQFDLFAKGGVGYIHQAEQPKGFTDNSQGKLNTFAVNYGAGIGWRYNSFGARVDYTQYKPTQAVDSRFDILDTVGLTLTYTWG